MATDNQSEFWRAYKDPRWLATARRIRERAGGKCEECGDPLESLHVHHTYYARDRKPWEYPDESLRCWCTYCHGLFHDLKDALNEKAGMMTIRTFEWLKVAASVLLSAQCEATRRERYPELAEALDGLMASWSAKAGGE
jgi:5-methylcytosine-specific restriction endonuclease McrA